jgi:hypothetical protein
MPAMIRRKPPGREWLGVGIQKALTLLLTAAAALIAGLSPVAAGPVEVTLHRSARTREDAWPPRGSSTLDVTVGDVTSQIVVLPEGDQTVKVGVAASAPLTAIDLPAVTVTAGITAPVRGDTAELRASLRWEISRFARGGVWACRGTEGDHQIAASLSVDWFAI